MKKFVHFLKENYLYLIGYFFCGLWLACEIIKIIAFYEN